MKRARWRRGCCQRRSGAEGGWRGVEEGPADSGLCVYSRCGSSVNDKYQIRLRDPPNPLAVLMSVVKSRHESSSPSGVAGYRGWTPLHLKRCGKAIKLSGS